MLVLLIFNHGKAKIYICVLDSRNIGGEKDESHF